MSTVQPTDKLLVQRGTTQHSAPADMSTVQDTDLILVNRAGVDYKCTIADWKASQGKAPAIASVTLADSPEAGRFSSGTFRNTVVMTDEGIPASTKGIKAYVQGVLKSAAQSSGIASVAVTPNYTGMLTGVGGTCSDLGNFFDASATTYANCVAGADLLFTPATPIPFTTLEVSTFDDATVSLNGGAMQAVTPTGSGSIGWRSVPVAPGTINTLRLSRGAGGATMGGIRIDGQVLLSGATVLTLTDSTNLSSFAAGDAITEVTAAGVAGDATGTVGSVDATAKTITLSATAGTWDVGSAVKGPLKAVNKTPNSDTIVQVGAGPTYSAGTRTGVYPDPKWHKLFDGNLGTSTYVDDYAGQWSTLTLSTPITWKSSVRLYAERSRVGTQEIIINGQRITTFSAAGWIDLTPLLLAKGITSITSFTCGDAGASAGLAQSQVMVTFCAVEVDGVILVDGATTLTFSSAKELTDFAAGDAVNQDSAFTPNTDVITAVSSLNVIAITATDQHVSYTGGTPTVNPNAYTIQFWRRFTGTVAPNQDRLFNYSTGGNDALLPIITPSGAFGVFEAVSSSALSALTLSSPDLPLVTYGSGWHHYAVVRNNNDIKLFIDGKIVAHLTNSPKRPSASGAKWQIGIDHAAGYTSTSQFRTCQYDSAALYSADFVPSFGDATPVATTQILFAQGANLTANQGTAGGSFAATSATAGVPVLTFATAKDLAALAAGDAVSQNDSAASGTVASIDTTAKTMTLATSTGTWSANTGKFVIGPAKTASGTVSSVDTTALTMTLATSTGTWTPNKSKFVIGPTKPSSSVKLFCKLNAGLTVTDLQSPDPGFTAVTGAGPYTVTFPATLPSGAAPDVDLPAGTSLTTEVQAVNSGGTVTKISNTITPAP